MYHFKTGKSIVEENELRKEYQSSLPSLCAFGNHLPTLNRQIKISTFCKLLKSGVDHDCLHESIEQLSMIYFDDFRKNQLNSSLVINELALVLGDESNQKLDVR